MNRTAVALAADSAATFGRGQKIYRAAEKLFEVSRFPPVAIMLCGAAELMDMPWETLIKTWIRESTGRAYPRLEQYADDFLRAAEAQTALFPPALQADWFRAGVRRYWKEAFLEPVAARLGGETPGTSRAASQLLGRLLAREIAAWRRLPPLGAGDGYAAKVLETYAPVLDRLEEELFAPFRLPRGFAARFRQAVGLMHERAWVHPGEQSGLVFAGMGAEEAFPAVLDYQVGTIAAGRLRFFKVGEAAISRQVSAIVAPFGVTDMVDLFYRGIDPALEERLYGIVERTLARAPGHARGRAGTARRRRTVESIRKAFAAEITGTWQAPLITAVEALPRHGLAAMAEALVSLTALKLRMSVEMAETVGGAIDVAVLSRGDGFTWIRRASPEPAAPGLAIP